MNKTIWLLRRLYHHPEGLSREAICEAWREADDRGRAMAKSTFYDNRNYLATRFGVEVAFEDGRYRLVFDSAESEAVVGRIVAADGGAANSTPDSNVPGREWVGVLSEAIAACRHVVIGYTSPHHGDYDTDLCPYLLRLVGGYFYVVGLSHRHGSVRTFAVDRIRYVRPRRTVFRRPPHFTADDWFGDSIGAFGGSDLPKAHIVIRPLNEAITAYLRQRAIHRSQAELPGPTFTLDVAPTPDVISRLLTFGDQIVILSPDTLRRRLADIGRGIARLNGEGPDEA